ncbi:hypothetical protein [Nocardia brevicatena]|uniref:hypothetical protein n=1 Tax=Nocardia brevicatena TaxID=37327 RepID=UPI0002D86CBD|nr:hypothetical protein [Nocardia brevicatena]
MNVPPVDVRERWILARLARARAAFYGSKPTYIGGGRRSEPTVRHGRAAEDLHAAKQARNRLLVELVGDATTVPLELAKRLDLTGREAASIVHVARSGSRLLRNDLLG